MEPELSGDFGGTFAFEPHWIEGGGVEPQRVDEGPRNGATFLMLHGNPTWSYMYRRPIAELAAGGHRCVAVDHMGFGRSDKPPHLRDYTLETHIENVGRLIDELDLRDIVLAAHD